MKDKDFENKTLLRIKRKYSRDEEMGLLVDMLKKREIKNGELLSEISELRYKNKGQEIELEIRGKELKSLNSALEKVRLKNNRLHIGIVKDEKIAALTKRVKELKKVNEQLISKLSAFRNNQTKES